MHVKEQNYNIQKNYLIFIILLFFTPRLLHSQERSALKKFLYTNKISDKEKIIKTDSLIEIYSSEKVDSLSLIYYEYAFWLFNKVPVIKVIELQNKAFELAKKNTSSYTQVIGRDLAFYYSSNNQLEESIKIHHEIISIKNDNRAAAYSYLGLADIYYDLNDYYKAYEYYEVAIKQLSKFGNNEIIALRNAYNNLTQICFFIKTKESLVNGNKFGMLGDSLAKITKTSLNEKFYIKRNLGLTFNEEENLDFDKALNYFNQALEIANKSKDSAIIRSAYRNLGDLYNIYNKYKSVAFYKIALQHVNRKDTINLSDIHYGLGHTYSIWKDFEISLEYRYKALQFLTGYDFYKINSITNDFLSDFNFSLKKSLLINLTQLAQTYLNYYEVKKNNEFLDRAISYFKMCDILIDALKVNSSGFKSRLYWRELSTDIYGKAIKACFLRNNTKDAFYFMEKNKALLLLEDIHNKSFKRQAQLNPQISEHYNILKKEIALTNNHLIDESKWSKSELDSLKKQRIDLDIKLSILEDENNITYETLDIETSILSLKEVQNSLSDNDVMVEYHISIDDGYGILTNKDNGYALFISKDDTQLFEINNLDKLKNEITTLINSLKSPFSTQNDIDKFNTLSNIIYNKLFPSNEIKQLIKGKILTIAPDSYLSLLPFEALSTKSDSTFYLIRDAEVHYIYSNSFLKNIERPVTSNNSKSLVVAPVNFNNNLVSLTNSLSEVNNIQDYYSGSLLLEQQATKSNFLNALNNTSNGIIHIASHANAQDKVAPWIAFNDENITLEELYLTQNNASLVVLSGCNTSVGKQEIGEGVMSLARGFFYSGSQSVISSLWSIDDRSTSKIVNTFYKNLSEGQTKSKALHNAKIEYLDNHNDSEASPHFWASLILLGQNDMLEPSKSYWQFLVIGGFFIILTFYFFRKSKS